MIDLEMLDFEFNDVFSKVESSDHIPYDFQRALSKSILSGKNVILQAPTGAGKTIAAIIPFLIAQKIGVKDFPVKLIYSLPLRTLTNDLYKEVTERDFIRGDLNLPISIQTGDAPKDSFFESDIIFATIDQSLSGYLAFPLSLPRKLANINSGALVGAYLIFDEFHLFDPDRALPTVLEMLKQTKSTSRFCIMTATMSDKLVAKIGDELNAVLISPSLADLELIKSIANKTKKLNLSEKPLDVDSIVNIHFQNQKANTKTLVFCNTVDRCQQTYSTIKERIKKRAEHTEVLQIHSRFFSDDRKERENKIKKLFGKGSTSSAILISTQVSEVGLNITSDFLHTELAPINSLIQRFGRCARYTGENGEIFIYNIERNDRLTNPFLPYKKEICEATWENLVKIDGENLTYNLSNELVNDLLTSPEEKIFTRYKENSIRNKIFEAHRRNEKSLSRELIREIDLKSVNIIIHDKPDTIQEPYRMETVSMRCYGLMNKLRPIESCFASAVIIDDDNEWLVKRIRYTESEETELNYQFVTIPVSAIEEEHLIVLNNKFVTYSKEAGLVVEVPGIPSRTSKKIEKNRHEAYYYEKETYEEHIGKMLKVLDSCFRKEIDYLSPKFEDKFTTQGLLSDLLRLMIVLHDSGKLNQQWQNLAHQIETSSSDLLAHTSKREGFKRPPPHAAISGHIADFVLFDLMDSVTPSEDLSDSLRKVIMTAISKHHSVDIRRLESFRLVNEGKDHLEILIERFTNNSIQFLNPEIERIEEANTNFDERLISYQDIDENIWYHIFVRFLRLCDQRSFEETLGENDNVSG